MDNIEIGKRIKKLRQANNLSQDQLAKALGYKSNAVISKLENGNSELTASQIKMLSNYFKVSSAYILKGINNDNENNKSFAVSKNIKIKKSLAFLKMKDYVIISLPLIAIIISVFLKNSQKAYTLAIILAISLMMTIYFIIRKILYNKKNIISTNIPLNKEVTYFNLESPEQIKKYKNNFVGSGILVILTNIIFYGIIITTITEKLDTTPLFLVLLLLIIVVIKSVIYIISNKTVEIDVTFLLILIFSVELFVSVFYLFYLNYYNILSNQITLISVFNLTMFLLTIFTLDLFLQKYDYKIE